jgi:hypothetical protein
VQGFKGYLQSDGYASYNCYANQPGVTHLGCWEHARRKFFEALENDKTRATLALAFIGKLYEVETHCRDRQLSTNDKKSYRLDHALPVLEAFSTWLKENYQVLPKSIMGKAMAYTMTRWEQLSNYLMDGMLEIDNNKIENVIRPVALGRKNYLFAGSHPAAQRAAMSYSFFAIPILGTGSVKKKKSTHSNGSNTSSITSWIQTSRKYKSSCPKIINCL